MTDKINKALEHLAFVKAFAEKGAAAFFDLPDRVILDGLEVETKVLFNRHCANRWINQIIEPIVFAAKSHRSKNPTTQER